MSLILAWAILLLLKSTCKGHLLIFYGLEVLAELEVKATGDSVPRFSKAIGKAASSSTTVPVRETSPPALDRQLFLQEIFPRKRVWIK